VSPVRKGCVCLTLAHGEIRIVYHEVRTVALPSSALAEKFA
jgi:hypothetical protein